MKQQSIASPAPTELWPPAGQLVTSAIIGHVTLADVAGRAGAWRWVLTDPHRLTKPVTGCAGILACGSSTCRPGCPAAETPGG